MAILRGTERSMVRAMCGVQLKGRNICKFDVDVGFEWNH